MKHSANNPLLHIDQIHVVIAAVNALRGFSLDIYEGQMLSLTGRNGAGKTSLMRTIMGHLKPVQGLIEWNGTSLIHMPLHKRAAEGIGYMPEDRGLVPELSVEENILLPIWVSRTLVAEERLELVYRVLPELKIMRDRKALLLSGGQQKLVAMARALAVGTKLLLLDEPFEGVAPALAQRLSEVIAGLRGSRLSVLITQSESNHAEGLTDLDIVIERGTNQSQAKGTV
jgi:branched-chain amino acid transport system ATP-binding protein